MSKKNTAIAIKRFAMLVVLGAVYQAMAQEAKTIYSQMAPVDQYLMEDRAAEIVLARSTAPESISHDAEVQVLGRHGFETAVKGTNGFVRIVGRSWTSAADPDFWNPKVRVPPSWVCATPWSTRHSSCWRCHSGRTEPRVANPPGIMISINKPIWTRPGPNPSPTLGNFDHQHSQPECG